MNTKINLQIACDDPLPVNGKTIKHWLKLTLKEQLCRREVTVRLVTKDEITALNTTYRNKNKPTNVLAFPSQLPDSIVLKYSPLGDIVICPAVLLQEALEQKKTLLDHWAHIVIHGCLHLLGFDHIETQDATRMQAKEIELLKQLNINNPYHNEDDYLE
jgi:probable rRNA maturation factor